jgi:hypothetical protein
MKYLNKFDLLLETTPPKIFISIRKDSLELLSYLIDARYEVTTRNNLRYVVTTIGKGPHTTIYWKDVKYDILQYLEFMSSKYNLEFIEFIDHRKSENNINFNKIYRDFEQIEKDDDFLFTYINISFNKNWKRKVNESIGRTYQYIKMEKIVNEYLQYLIDDNFVITMDIFAEEITIKKRDDSRFDWNDVKYDIIPFMEELLKEHTLYKSGSRTGIIFVYYSKPNVSNPEFGNNEFINLDEILNDTIEGTMTGIVIELKN